MIPACRLCSEPPGNELCEECKKSLIETGTIHEICEALQDYDGSFYTVCTQKQGAYHYTVLTFVVQDECDVVALGRGRTVEQSNRQCAINYRRTREAEESV